MCLALPALVASLEPDNTAVVALDGVRKRISIALVDDVAVGDYVLIHVGYALHKVSIEEAERTLAMMAETGALAEELHELGANAS
jgi:hydrogenase expression/formation protein HypC